MFGVCVAMKYIEQLCDYSFVFRTLLFAATMIPVLEIGVIIIEVKLQVTAL